MNSLKLNSKAEITNVYNAVIQDVIKNIKDVFKDENISQYVLRDLESLWTSKFLNTRQPTLPVILVPMKIMVPFKKSPSSENTETREIELMIPHHEAELLDFSAIFPESIINGVVHLSNRMATTFLQQRINTFLVSKDQVENMLTLKEVPDDSETMEQDPLEDYVATKTVDLEQDPLDDFVTVNAKPDDVFTVKTKPLDDVATVGTKATNDIVTVKMEPLDDVVTVNTKVDDAVTIKEEPLDDFVTINEEPLFFAGAEAVPQSDGANDSSDDSSDDSRTPYYQKSEEIEQSTYGSDGESLNSDDDVTDEDIETLFSCDNVILCQYMKVLRCKNKWRFYFKDGVMNLNGCDYAFHKIFGDAPW